MKILNAVSLMQLNGRGPQ